MEITTHIHEERCVLELNGRLDANWSEHVGQAIETAIRSGQHHLDLDFGKIHYVSSAGLRILIKYFKQLKSARGSLRIVRPTADALEILNLSGMSSLLVHHPSTPATPATAPAGPTPSAIASATAPATTPTSTPAPPREWEHEGVAMAAYELDPQARLTLQHRGHPENFGQGSLQAAESTVVRCAADVMAVGLGAFGRQADDTRTRFGESLAVAGTALSMPTDGSSLPDYQVTEASLVPELSLLYGLVAQGAFRHLLRFEAAASPRGTLGLSSLLNAALETTATEAAGFVILAESAGLVGATLRQSPALADGRSPWEFPAIRDWLSFTTERTDERSVILIVGFAARTPSPATAPFLRPLGSTSAPLPAHCHAAVFPYRPLPKGRLDLMESVTSLLATDSAQTVLHLMSDDRPFEGLGETDLMRGACWVGPLDDPSTPRAH
jgi:anti-anti-sigma factor